MSEQGAKAIACLGVGCGKPTMNERGLCDRCEAEGVSSINDLVFQVHTTLDVIKMIQGEDHLEQMVAKLEELAPDGRYHFLISDVRAFIAYLRSQHALTGF